MAGRMRKFGNVHAHALPLYLNLSHVLSSVAVNAVHGDPWTDLEGVRKVVYFMRFQFLIFRLRFSASTLQLLLMYHLICKDQEVNSEEENNGYVVLK